MLGHEEESGIMFLTIEELFTKISSYSSDREYKIIKASYKAYDSIDKS